MPVYKDGDSGSWRAQFYYTDWTGKKHKKNKRGFRTKKEAQQYEAEYIRVHMCVQGGMIPLLSVLFYLIKNIF